MKSGQAKPGKRPPDIRKAAWDQVAQEPVLTTDTMTLVCMSEAPWSLERNRVLLEASLRGYL